MFYTNVKSENYLRYAPHGESEGVVIGEFLAADVESIESIVDHLFCLDESDIAFVGHSDVDLPESIFTGAAYTRLKV